MRCLSCLCRTLKVLVCGLCWTGCSLSIYEYKLPTWCTDYYLFIKYYSPLHVSSLKCSSSGGYSCIHAAYGTVTLYESSWWPVGTQLEWELTVGGRMLVGRRKTPYQQPSPYSQFSLKLCTDRPPRTLVESDSTICCMYTTVSSLRWALEARNM